ncbi:MAG: Na/Pi cotransporter family protein [Bacteroidales bacterium]|nr:Na/Pi cotransporter family protein [Bacteroidales bacterium]
METVFQVLKMLGCLGMFLYGMSLMSGGLQKLAGNSLRSFLAKMTSNRFKCVLTGIVVTALVQSSTATTLMLVSFVNAGLLALANAIGVIMGANIGTTVTAWLFALSFDGSFSLGAIAIPLMAVAFLFLSLKGQRNKNLGEFIMGFALLFLGLATLKDTAYPLLSSDGVRTFLAPLTSFGVGSILLFMVIGAAMTLMLQSSAATMSLTMMFVAFGVIPFSLAAAMVLGENIGTTITSNIAASVANVSAKRTARSHMLFNVFGVIWAFALFHPFLNLIGTIVEAIGVPNPITTEIFTQTQLAAAADEATREAMLAQNEDLAAALPYCVAVLHTLFNLINTLILIWFVPLIERIVTWMVPSPKDEKEVFRLKYINHGPMSTAEIAVTESSQEIINFGRICHQGFGYLKEAVHAEDMDAFEPLNEKLIKYEEITDKIEFEIASYLKEITKNEVSLETSERIKSMYRAIGEMESLGDSGEAIGRLLKRKLSHNKKFSADMLTKIDRMTALVDNAFDAMMFNLQQSSLRSIQNAVTAEVEINACRDALRDEHIRNIETPTYDYSTGVYYMDLITELEKIGDFIINISEAKLGISKYHD